MRRKSWWLVAVLVLGLVAVVPSPARAEADGCDDGGGGSQDIDTLAASFDEATEVITVDLTRCTAADSRTKYRVHFDHTAPFATDPDRNGDGYINGDDFCVTTSDDTMMHRARRDTGPGQIDGNGNVLTYTVWMGELSPDLMVGDTIYVWADTQNKGNVDRAPDTDDSDGCGKPEEEGEFVELELTTFDCSKPIDELTMIWDGGGTIKVRAWKGAPGSTLLGEVTGVTDGTEVSFAGFAGSPNDVFWEIFDNASGAKIGESTFHLSCSDNDLDGPEDCGNRQGNGKANDSAFINGWLFEGMVDSDETLDCKG